MTDLAPWLLEILACPRCRTRLVLHPTGASLRCGPCALSFPIRDGIPILLLSEASPVADRELDEASGRT